jgi:hypothetical protein
MTWVERVKNYYEVKIFKRLIVTTLTFASAASGLVALARAATTSFIDHGPGRVVPMYGVPVTFGPPVVKYGPAPVPTATVSPDWPVFTGMPTFHWNSMFPSWSFGDRPSLSFSAPDFSHIMPSFPKLFGLAASDILSMLALVAYVSLLLAAVCGWALRGSAWYLKNKYKK